MGFKGRLLFFGYPLAEILARELDILLGDGYPVDLGDDLVGLGEGRARQQREAEDGNETG